MITSLLLTLLSGFYTMCTYFLTAWYLPTELTTGVTTILDHALTVNGIIPIAQIIFALSIIMAFQIMRFTFNAVIGFISLFRGGGSMSI